MTTVIRYFTLLGLVIFFCACGRYAEQRWAREAIAMAEAIMEQQPDSALHLLQSISAPAILAEEQQMAYRLRLLQAKDKCNLDITADTNIVEVSDYFKQRKDWHRAAWAAFYQARVWQERNDKQKAMQAYLNAETYASHTNDYRLKGMVQHNIGELYLKQLALQKSIVAYKKAADYFQQIDSTIYPHIVYTYQSLSGIYIALEQLDSALFYNDKGLSLAQNCGDILGKYETEVLQLHQTADDAFALKRFQ